MQNPLVLYTVDNRFFLIIIIINNKRVFYQIIQTSVGE